MQDSQEAGAVRAGRGAGPAAEDLNQVRADRRAKLEQRRLKGQAYPNGFRRDSLTSNVRQSCGELSADALEAASKSFALAGRVMLKRVMGKAAFLVLQDMGGQLQLYLARDKLPPGVYDDEVKKLDLGDLVGVKGVAFRTRTGELTLMVQSFELLVKSLRPLPEKFKGLTDPELRYRQRYLDLIANEGTRALFVTRTRVLQAIRRFMDAEGFLEVETPMMHPLPGGANARPFITHHHALDQDMYLRIAPELYLKRLVVGGLERVYEINRNFRNEGIDLRHNPEFTMMEFYMAYHDYRDLMDLTERLLRQVAGEVLGSTKLHYGREGEPGFEVDFNAPFRRLTMREALVSLAGVSAAELDDEQALAARVRRAGVTPLAGWTRGHLISALFEELVEAKLIEPTFITEYPAAVSPLARRSDKDPDFTDRFEFFIGGRELGNGFSELNDPDDQAARFRAQAEAKSHGDDEAMFYDADYVAALEYGLPPTAGEGLGIDRLVMLLTNSQNIRDVILFPALRNLEARRAAGDSPADATKGAAGKTAP